LPGTARADGVYRSGVRRFALVLAVTAALVLPAAAVGAPGIQFGIQDDMWLQTGSLESRLNTLDRLGPDVVRYTLRWDQVAGKRPKRATNPNDKAYNWSQVDPLLRGLRKHRIGVLVTLYGAPRWANGHRAPNFAPSSKWALSSFAVAAAKRYPWVRRWEVWNEPNLRTFLRPNLPRVYVTRLLNPTYDALHGVRRGMRVAGGATSPRQTPSGMAPAQFMRGMSAAHARLDVYSHHPYPVSRFETPSRANCRYCSGILTLARLPDLVAEVRRDFGSKRIWLTEYGYQTNPPDRYLGVSKTQQALYLAQAAYLAYKSPLVDLMIHFLVRDERKTGRWQSGLMTVGGSPKPSLKAFAIPLAQLSHEGTQTVFWGQVRPGFGRQRYRIQRAVRGRWRDVGSSRWTSPRGYFQRTVEAEPGTRFRVLAVRKRISSLSLKVR
jgi:hypothetical protein